MSDDTQHAQRASVHASQTSANTAVSVTLTVDTGDATHTIRFKAHPGQLTFNTEVIPDETIAPNPKILKAIAKQVNFTLDAENLIADPAGVFLTRETVAK